MKSKWLQAATIGSIWASFEIIIGSFLHNVRLPFAGTILSFFAVMLMVSFLRLWPRRGIIWRAALICALMKSISPSAVILGPMTGIFLEGLLMEMAIFMLGVNPVGMIAGGMLAVFSALIHKAINLLILYGWDLARLLDNLVTFATRQIGIGSLDGVEVLLILCGIYLVSGALASILGLTLARRALRVREPAGSFSPASRSSNTLFEYSDPGKYSVWLLFLHVVCLTVVMIFLTRLNQWWAMLIPVPYLVFCFISYRRSLRQLFRVKLWIQIILITFLASLFLTGMKSGNWFTAEGFRAGIMMNLRAILMLTGFSAISTEMKNPVIKTILYGRGFAPLYKSLSLAFSVLPEIIGTVTEKHNTLKGVSGLLEKQLLRADQLYDRFRDLEQALPKVILIMGDRAEGKTTFLRQRVNEMISGGMHLSGFIAEGIHSPGGVREGYRIVNINTGEAVDFCLNKGPENWEKVGRFRISPDGLAKGMEWLSPDVCRNSDFLVIDELGPLELAGKGWAPLIERILRESPKSMIWTVRRQLAGKIAHKWNIGEVTFIDVAGEG
ncbi:MAG: nucleoside-triphosphatase [Bacteroidota bacterium]